MDHEAAGYPSSVVRRESAWTIWSTTIDAGRRILVLHGYSGNGSSLEVRNHCCDTKVKVSQPQNRILFFREPPESNEKEGPNRDTSIT